MEKEEYNTNISAYANEYKNFMKIITLLEIIKLIA